MMQYEPLTQKPLSQGQGQFIGGSPYQSSYQQTYQQPITTYQQPGYLRTELQTIEQRIAKDK
jgi:hypothetical protein